VPPNRNESSKRMSSSLPLGVVQVVRTGFLLSIVILFMLCNTPVIAQGGQTDARVQRGEVLARKICWACHVVAADQEFSPILREPAPDFRRIAARRDVTAESLSAFLHTTHGVAQSTPYKMPNPRLTEEMIDNVVRYILSLGTK